MLPKEMYGRSTANEQKIKEFTMALDRRGGRATFEKVMVEVSELGGDEIRAMVTLVNSEATDFKNIREILNHALSGESKQYQSTIRILNDNGWINTTRNSDGLEFIITDNGYEKLEWL